MLELHLRLIPLWANFKDLDTLVSDTKSQVKLWTNVRSRPPPLDERTDDTLAPLLLKLTFSAIFYATQRSGSAASLSARSSNRDVWNLLLGTMVAQRTIPAR